MYSHTSTQLIIAALLAGGISAAACIMRMLTVSGAIAAFVVGFVIYGAGGIAFAGPLVAFFLSSSVLSQIGKDKKARANAGYEKAGARDAGQVLANGVVPAILALAFALTQQTRLATLVYLASLAAVNADTWATELGGLSKNPRLVTNLKRVDAGTSGAVTLLGLFASLIGALVIPVAAWLVWPQRSVQLLWIVDPPEIIAITWAGFLAAYLDSLLGATIQGRFECRKCKSETERRVHCGKQAVRTRGLAWINNDVVNLITSGAGALAGWILLKFYAYPI